LGATGKIHVRIIGINVATSLATINAIFALARLKAPAAKLGIDSHSG
jgi:hypothetical protein